MAKRTKSRQTSKKNVDEQTVDTPESDIVSEESSAETPEPAVADIASEGLDENINTDEATESELTEISDEIETENQIDEDDTSSGLNAVVDERVSEPTPETVTPIVAEPKKSGFGGTLLGGAIAAALGFGAAYYFFEMRTSSSDLALQAQLETLQSEVTELRTGIDGVTQSVDGVATTAEDLGVNIGDMGGVVSENGARIAKVEEMILTPLEGDVSENAIAEMNALRQELNNQKTQLDELLAETNAELEAARNQAESLQTNTMQAARDNATRAASFQIVSAIETGVPFRDALTELEAASDAPVPSALAESADTGVPTLGDLNDEYSTYANAALVAARDAGVSGEDLGGVSGFFRSQFNVRSTEPQDGDDANAVLSRVTGELKAGNLENVLSEIQMLPDVSQDAMSDWIALAQQRQSALEAIISINPN